MESIPIQVNGVFKDSTRELNFYIWNWTSELPGRSAGS